MTRNELIAELNARTEDDGAPKYFAGDFAGHYDISDDEVERIAERAENADEFEAIWENEDWWTDANN